ncbi:MAG: ParB/RepB/Spo0J family partition protein [Bacilli bacterium]
MSDEEKVINLDINLLTPNRYQPRKVFNDSSIQELATSIKEYGILNPILVRKYNDKYEIIAGERRYRAAKLLGLKTVPVIVKNISDEQTAKIALIENIQRENLSPIEEAKAYQQILDISKITQNDLANILGKSQSTIANKIRLLSLPTDIQEALATKKISERHARSLMTINNPNRQTELLKQIIEKKLTVRELDDLIKKEASNDKNVEMTISNIMESINQKEEKESDNMNNGNFFPNYNNQINQNQNPNSSLNTLNMQSMNESPLPVANETVMPSQPQPEPMANENQTFNSFPNQAPIEPMMTPQMPNIDNNQPTSIEQFQPIFNTDNVNPIPDFNTTMNVQNTIQQEPTPDFSNVNNGNQEMPSMSTNISANNQPTTIQEVGNQEPNINTPLFSEEPITTVNNFEQPIFNTQSANVEPLPNLVGENQFIPTPNIQEPAMPSIEESQSTATPNFEVPITSVPENNSETDKLTKTTDFLNQNNIQYKLYSNESGHCIIIEI